MALLEVEHLKTYFPHKEGQVCVVDDISFSVEEGECFGIIGESGCGKSMTANSIMRYEAETGAYHAGGDIRFEGRSIYDLNDSEISDYRGGQAAIILQNPMSAFDPLYTVGDQMVETMLRHGEETKAEAEKRAAEIFRFLGIAEEKMRSYPFQLSGGMLQRIAGGIAVSTRPKLIIADEPTTALDATVSIQYMQLLEQIRKTWHTAILFISHDIRLVGMICEKIAVMYAGRIVETGLAQEILDHPGHPYTKALINAARYSGDRKQRFATLEGQPPFLLNPENGCRFAGRCSKAKEGCFHRDPEAVSASDTHTIYCENSDRGEQ